MHSQERSRSGKGEASAGIFSYEAKLNISQEKSPELQKEKKTKSPAPRIQRGLITQRPGNASLKSKRKTRGERRRERTNKKERLIDTTRLGYAGLRDAFR